MNTVDVVLRVDSEAHDYFCRGWLLHLEQLREQHPGWVPNLSGIVFEGSDAWRNSDEEIREFPHDPIHTTGLIMDRRGWDLHGINFRGSSFYLVDFSGANFSGANLCGVHFSRCRLDNADLKGVTTDEHTIWPHPNDVPRPGDNSDGPYRLQQQPKEPSL